MIIAVVKQPEKPHWSLRFLSGLSLQLNKLLYNCEDHFYLYCNVVCVVPIVVVRFDLVAIVVYTNLTASLLSASSKSLSLLSAYCFSRKILQTKRFETIVNLKITAAGNIFLGVP